jgi:hypothetical protein
MKIFIYALHRATDKRTLVATFADEHWAEMALHRFETVRGKHYTFTLETNAPPVPVTSLQPPKDVQVDLTQAHPTQRPIAYALSCRVEHNMRIYLAYTPRYGTIRGTVEDSEKGATLFMSRLHTVWPNSQIESK